MSKEYGRQFPGKEEYVREVFGAIAPIYDLMNTVMTLGLVKRWRKALLARINPEAGAKVLDVGTGTGEMAFLLADLTGPGGEVWGVDFSPHMLVLARRKMAARFRPGGSAPLTFLTGDALALPLPGESFHYVTSAFVLRNVNDIPLALREMVRVCKPGGQVICLDISRPPGFWGRCFDLWFHGMIPKLGRLAGKGKAVRGRAPAYKWLSESLHSFPQGEDMAGVFRECGLRDVSFEPLSGGLSTLYWGFK